MSSRVLNYQTPISSLMKSYPHFKSVNSLPFRISVCIALVHNHSPNQSKLEPRAIKCVYLSYSPTQKDYKCYYTLQKNSRHPKMLPSLSLIPISQPLLFKRRHNQVKIVSRNYHCLILLRSLLFLLLVSWLNRLCHHQIKKT